MTQEEFDAIVANNNERRTISANGVSNGYEVRGSRLFTDPVSGVAVFQTNYEVIAVDSAEALTHITSFLDTGTF